MRDLGMTTLASFDLVDDEAWLGSVARDSLLVGVAGLCVTGAWLVAGLAHEPVGVRWFLAVVAASVVALPVHELVHGLAFKALGGRDVRVRFGYLSPGLLFTAAEGAVFSRRAFMATLLAPAVALSLAFLAAGTLLQAPLAALTCLWLHLSGCTGDLSMARILADSDGPYVRDTATGFDLVAPDAEAVSRG